MPIEGGSDLRCYQGPRYESWFEDEAARTAGVSRKYGVEVTPQTLRLAEMSGETHCGGCLLYRNNPEIVRERLLAIARANSEGGKKGWADYLIEALDWTAGLFSRAFAALFRRGSRRPVQGEPQVASSRVLGLVEPLETTSHRFAGSAAYFNPNGARAVANELSYTAPRINLSPRARPTVVIPVQHPYLNVFSEIP